MVILAHLYTIFFHASASFSHQDCGTVGPAVMAEVLDEPRGQALTLYRPFNALHQLVAWFVNLSAAEVSVDMF